jgi:phosphoserine phosphatase RsbX
VGGLTAEEGVVLLRPPDVLVRWAAAGVAARGQTASGDRHVVLEVPGAAMIGLVDALCHGPRAAAVAEAAVAALAASSETSPAARVSVCHRALTATRGAVVALATIDASGCLTWTGVGNVEAVLLRPGRGRVRVEGALAPRGGVLGMRLPPLAEQRHRLEPGDLLAMASDGIDPAFVADVREGVEPGATVERIIRGRSRGHDDGLVVLARFESRAPADRGTAQ